jgi:hypothetical protein
MEEQAEAPLVVPGSIPQFPNLTEYFEPKPEYNDLLPSEQRRVYKYSTRPLPEVEQEKEEIAQDDAVQEFTQNMRELDNAILKIPIKKPSILSRMWEDFRLWRESRPKRRYVEVKTPMQLQKLLHDVRNENADVLPFTPAYIVEKTGQLANLLTHFASSEILIRAGLRNLNADQLAEQGILISNLRTYHRTPAEMAKFFTTFERLLNAGFNKLQFDSRLWTLGAFAKAYKMEPVLMGHMCNMEVRDLLYAGVSPLDLPAFGITAERIQTDKNPFEIFYALRLSPEQLQQHFAFQPNHLFVGKKVLMNNIQLCILTHSCQWTISNLRAIGVDEGQLQVLGMRPKLKLDLRLTK